MFSVQILFRSLHPDDAAFAPGEVLTLAQPVEAAPDPGAATGSFASEQVLALLLEDGARLEAGTRLVVAGERRMRHHLPSAVDIEVVVLAVASTGVPEDELDPAFSRAMMQVSLALAAGGADGAAVPEEFSAPLPVKI